MSREYFRRIEKKYGLTFEGLLELLTSQESKCACCGKELVLLSSDPKERPNVDHIHGVDGPGGVRGLLCLPCNTKLGHIEKDIYRTYALMVYAGHIDNFIAAAGGPAEQPTRDLPLARLAPALVAAGTKKKSRAEVKAKAAGLSELLSGLWWYKKPKP